MDLKRLVASQIRRHPRLAGLLIGAARMVSPETVVVLDYPVHARQRWDRENPHQGLSDVINGNRESYFRDLNFFLELSDWFTGIPAREAAGTEPGEPFWINGWMPALDGVALYSYLVKHKPGIYMEVGSGNSTKFARKAINDHNLDTRIISIDPSPRAEVDGICDEVIRKPVEEVDLALFERLGPGDILYVDNSHRVFMNSDATAVFLDVIPMLKPGVLVQIHDVTLPYDYPAEWADRHYSEQYLLAAYLLAKGNAVEVLLPNFFISQDDDLKKVLAPLWDNQEMKDVETHGCSFWLRIG